MNPVDIVELLDQGYAWTAGRVWAVRAHDLDRPTPCTRWDLRHLLNHLIGAQQLLTGAVAAPPPGTGPGLDADADAATVSQTLADADLVGTDPVGAYDAMVERAMAVWRTPDVLSGTCELPFGPAPVQVAARIALLDAVVHGWDVARATGEAADIPDELAEPILAFAPDLLAGAPRGTAFADEVTTDKPNSASDRLVAFLGRKPASA